MNVLFTMRWCKYDGQVCFRRSCDFLELSTGNVDVCSRFRGGRKFTLRMIDKSLSKRKFNS